MSLVSVALQNCRSLHNKTFKFSDRTVIIGDNGTGKSTLIEAIRLLSIGKSFRTSRLEEIISFNQAYFRLQAKRNLPEEQSIDFFYGQAFTEGPSGERSLTVNGKTLSLLDFVGNFPSVLFVPSDIEIVMGMPQIRRKYVDGVLWQVDAEFRQNYLDLNRVLKERAALLFMVKINRADPAELQPWNELLGKLTVSVRQKRQDYVDFVSGYLAKDEFQTEKGLVYQIHYQPSVTNLAEVAAQEIKTAQNLYGPHRDDIEILLKDRSARRFASRGQARTAVVLLKVIESQFLAGKLSHQPIILLDDMFSELDPANAEFLFGQLPPTSQVVATAIKPVTFLKDWQKLILES